MIKDVPQLKSWATVRCLVDLKKLLVVEAKQAESSWKTTPILLALTAKRDLQISLDVVSTEQCTG